MSRMISEGSCDTKDWSNGAENLALLQEWFIFYSKLNREVILNCQTVSHYYFITYIIYISYLFIYCICDQINVALVRRLSKT